MVFNQLDTELDGVINKFGILKTSYADIINALKSDGLRGALNSVWAGNGITKSDVENIKKYNALIDEGVNGQSAFYRTMLSSSKGAKELVASCNGFAVSQKKIDAATKNSTSSLIANKAAMLGMKAAAIALNAALTMGLSFAISKLCEGLDYLINYSERASEEARGRAQESRQTAAAHLDECKTIDDLIQKYRELADGDMRNVETREQIADIQKQIVDLFGNEAEGIDLVNGKLEDQLDILRDIQSAKLDTAVSSARGAYLDARDATKKHTPDEGNFWGDLWNPNSDNTITFDYWGDNAGRNKALDIIDKVWHENNYGRALVGSAGFDTYSMLGFNAELTLAQRLEALNAAIDALEAAENFDEK